MATYKELLKRMSDLGESIGRIQEEIESLKKDIAGAELSEIQRAMLSGVESLTLDVTKKKSTSPKAKSSGSGSVMTEDEIESRVNEQLKDGAKKTKAQVAEPYSLAGTHFRHMDKMVDAGTLKKDKSTPAKYWLK